MEVQCPIRSRCNIKCIKNELQYLPERNILNWKKIKLFPPPTISWSSLPQLCVMILWKFLRVAKHVLFSTWNIRVKLA
jgi:hypothetical protein